MCMQVAFPTDVMAEPLSPLHHTICFIAVCVGEEEDSGNPFPDGLQITCKQFSACLHPNVSCD